MFVQGRLRGCTALAVMLAASTCRAQTSSNTWSTQPPAKTQISSQLDEALFRLSQRPTDGPSIGEPALIAERNAPSLARPNALPRDGEPTPADPPADLSRVPFENFHFVPDDDKANDNIADGNGANNNGDSPQATETPLPHGHRRRQQHGQDSSHLTVGQGGYPIIDQPGNGTEFGGSNCDSGVCGTPIFYDTPIFCDAPCGRTTARGRSRSPLFDNARKMLRNFGSGSSGNRCDARGCRAGGNGACRGGNGACRGGNGAESSLFGDYFSQHPWSSNGCGFGSGGSVYGGIDYLTWWTRGMRIPALSTSSPSGTPLGAAGLHGGPTTNYLFGPGRRSSADHSGARFKFGYWFDDSRCRGIEADYFVLDESSFGHYAQAPEDYSILARPYYNTLTGAEDAELVGYPGLVEGQLIVRGTTDFQGGGIMFRKNLLCGPSTCGSACGGGGSGMFDWLHSSCDWLSSRLPACGSCLTPTRVDGLVGWRAFELDESLAVRESLTSTDTGGAFPVGTTFDIYDSFRTESTFNGVVFGTDAEWLASDRWGVGSQLRVSLGELQRRAFINGSTTTSAPGAGATTSDAGLLALPSNIGYYRDDEFVAIPEVGLDCFFMVRPDVRLSVGYTFIYIPDVWRPGDVIDRNIDPRLLPPPTVATADNPHFVPRSDDFWAQGINLGVEYRY